MYAGTRRSTLGSIGGSELSLQISSATSVEGDDFLPLIKNNGKHLRLVNKQSNSSKSRLDLMEALSLEPDDKGTETTRQGRSATPGYHPDDIKEASHEAEVAIKLCGSILAELDATRTSFNETPRLPPTTIVRQLSRRTTVKPRVKKSHPLTLIRTPVSPVNTVRRKPSVTKAQRKNCTKQRQMKTQRKSLGAKYATKNNSKWTENVSDLLSGKLFQKIEADEMLTPAQIKAYKLKRLSKLQLQNAISSETLATETVDTPVEPFHMDDLPARIGSSGVQLTANTPVDEKPDPVFFNEALRKDFSIDRTSNDDELFLGAPSSTLASSPSSSTDLTPNKDGAASSSQTQTKSPSRYVFRKISELPTISESLPRDDELFLSHGVTKARNDAADADYVFFRSTPYTLTAPRHRHGPIRLAKADLCPDPRLGADDGLDWTAFQMAILGGAGDYFTDSDHILRLQEAEDVEAICEWWDNWGFGGYGRLMTQDDEPKSPSTVSGDGDPLYHEIGRDNPYSARHRWRSLRRKAASEGRRLDLDLDRGDKLYNGGGIKKWSADGHASRLLERESMASLPQSPMLDLRVIAGDSDVVDFVPMGYNLSHDLGDFLNWETENVYSDSAMYQGGVI
ncbi:hypothetical protein TruAng_011163 [Truncatella angustata]|nr:hypothetical protein TruAng_011163 [Truncatella angustata]